MCNCNPTELESGYCTTCGKRVLYNTYHYCLWGNNNLSWPLTQNFYKCPTCGGEFNFPSVEYPTTSTKNISKCPWCGRIMEGI